MDGVLADFHGSFRKWHHPETNKFPQSNWGFFANLDPIEGGIETVKELMEHFDVWILTSPSVLNPLCYTEKRIWIEKYFGLEFCNKLIICPDKSLLKGDYLIDDCLNHGQTRFEGQLLRFGEGRKYKNWISVKKYLMGIPRKFESLVDEIGLDDLGTSGITFRVDALIKGKIYTEHCKWVDAWDGKGGMKQVPSGYVIDDNGCWNEIGSDNFNKIFKEIK